MVTFSGSHLQIFRHYLFAHLLKIHPPESIELPIQNRPAPQPETQNGTRRHCAMRAASVFGGQVLHCGCAWLRSSTERRSFSAEKSRPFAGIFPGHGSLFSPYHPSPVRPSRFSSGSPAPFRFRPSRACEGLPSPPRSPAARRGRGVCRNRPSCAPRRPSGTI